MAMGVEALILAAALAAAAPGEAEPVELMVLGSYHMGNPGRDLVNVKSDDVTQPRRQAELQAIADEIARWKPTKVAVEMQRPAPFAVEEYRSFTADQLKTKPNEIYQIGFRIAKQLGHRDVYGFDESPADGEPDYFPFGKVDAFARANGKGAMVDSMLDFFKRRATEQEQVQARLSVAELLLRHNDPKDEQESHGRGYYGMLAIGDADTQPGAELNAYWYMRNAKMFAKLGLIAEPGDRVLVLVGSGHNYWLRHFARETPGFVNVDPRPYLEAAAKQR
jgi:hypothetical protein